MEISNLIAAKRTITVEFGGVNYKITYDPSKTTRKQNQIWTDKVEEVQKDMEAVADLLDQQFIEMVVAWDLTENGEPCPITMETLATLPRPFVNVVRVAIFGDEGEMTKKDKRMTSMTG